MYHLSRMGPGSDTFPDIEEEENSYVDGIDNTSRNQHIDNTTAEQAAVPIVVQNLSLVDFHKCLIMHFDMAYLQCQIAWPSSARSRSTLCQKLLSNEVEFVKNDVF